MVIAALATLAVLAVLVQRWRDTKGVLPWNGIIAYLTTLCLWVIFGRANPLVLAVVPTFHSLQYLAVVWRYQINAGSQPPTSARPSILSRVLPTGVWSNLAIFIGVG